VRRTAERSVVARSSSTRSARSTSSVNPSTEGQRLLRAIDASLAQVARAIGCSKAVVGHWRAGEKLPSDPLRGRLHEVYGIAPTAWDLAAGTAPSAAAEPAEAPLVDVEGSDTLTLTNAQISAIQRSLARADLSDSARSKKEDTLAKLLALKARLERDDDEDRFVRGPKWKRFKERLLAALKEHPPAALAAAEALREAEG
jgi:transcriptional regulator with XRE-family HTH domain